MSALGRATSQTLKIGPYDCYYHLVRVYFFSVLSCFHAASIEGAITELIFVSFFCCCAPLYALVQQAPFAPFLGARSHIHTTCFTLWNARQRVCATECLSSLHAPMSGYKRAQSQCLGNFQRKFLEEILGEPKSWIHYQQGCHHSIGKMMGWVGPTY